MRYALPHHRLAAPARAGVLALVLLVLAGACTSSRADDAGPTTSTNPTDAAAQRLEGRYAHFDVVAYESTDMKTNIVSFGFTDLDIVDGQLQATESFCHADHRSDQPITVEMPDAATQAITPVPTPVTLTEVDGRARIARPATPTGIGIELEDPANTPLPTDPDDPRIVDDDGDGKPGVTTRITVTEDLQGELYLARREIFAYEVEEQADGTLTGEVTDDSEQLLLGASNDAFLTDAPWVQNPDLSLSPIVLVPVDRDWDCARLMSERDTLLPATPDVDW